MSFFQKSHLTIGEEYIKGQKRGHEFEDCIVIPCLFCAQGPPMTDFSVDSLLWGCVLGKVPWKQGGA